MNGGSSSGTRNGLGELAIDNDSSYVTDFQRTVHLDPEVRAAEALLVCRGSKGSSDESKQTTVHLEQTRGNQAKREREACSVHMNNLYATLMQGQRGILAAMESHRQIERALDIGEQPCCDINKRIIEWQSSLRTLLNNVIERFQPVPSATPTAGTTDSQNESPTVKRPALAAETADKPEGYWHSRCTTPSNSSSSSVFLPPAAAVHQTLAGHRQPTTDCNITSSQLRMYSKDKAKGVYAHAHGFRAQIKTGKGDSFVHWSRNAKSFVLGLWLFELGTVLVYKPRTLLALAANSNYSYIIEHSIDQVNSSASYLSSLSKQLLSFKGCDKLKKDECVTIRDLVEKLCVTEGITSPFYDNGWN
jgi:hypothetical protein